VTVSDDATGDGSPRISRQFADRGNARFAVATNQERTWTPEALSRKSLAGATRHVIEELGSTTASVEALDEATDLVARAAELLAGRPHGRKYEGPAEGSVAGLPGPDFVDNSPFVGEANPLAPPMRMESNGDHIFGHVEFAAPYEGAPGCVHGGFIAAAFDEVLGFVQSLTGRPGMTAQLDISFRSPTPIRRPLVYEGWVERVDGRKIFTRATLHHGETLCAEAVGLFISMTPELMERLISLRPDG
jgi:hypothetical protein